MTTPVESTHAAALPPVAIIGIRGLPPLYGGGETASDEIARRLVRRGRRVLVYCRNHNTDPPRPSEYHGVDLVHLPSLHTKNLDTPTHIVLCAIHLVFTRRAKIALLSGVGTWFIIPFLRVFGIRTAMWADGKDWERGKWGRFARWYLRWSAAQSVRFSNAIVTDTTIAHRLYQEEFGRETSYIPYGANIEEVDGTDELHKWGLEAGEYLLFVGRLIPEKGVHYLIHAFERVATEKRLVIIGDNPYNPEYVDELKRTTNPRILFTGYIFGDGFKQMMKHCWIYVQPSDVEGTSPVLLTAMGYGRAVVVNGIPENLATIGKAGLAFKPGDEESLQELIEELLRDPELVERLGQAGLERVRDEFDWEEITSKFEELFASLADSRGQRGRARDFA